VYVPDARALRARYQAHRRIGGMGMTELRTSLENVHEMIAALEEIRDHEETPEFRWLVEKMLPAERRRISEERNHISPEDPQYREKHLIFDGKILEVSDLTTHLDHVKRSLESLENEAKMINAAIDRLHQRMKK
jgi:hypothetical protein